MENGEENIMHRMRGISRAITPANILATTWIGGLTISDYLSGSNFLRVVPEAIATLGLVYETYRSVTNKPLDGRGYLATISGLGLSGVPQYISAFNNPSVSGDYFWGGLKLAFIPATLLLYSASEMGRRTLERITGRRVIPRE